MNHDVCKYILSCLVHKENKDITTNPMTQPPGHLHVKARGRKKKALESEQAVAKADHPVEKYGDVDHQIKKIRMEGMQLQVLKNCADAIRTCVDAIRMQIKLLKQMESNYVQRMGQDKYGNMIVSLMNQMHGMETSVDLSVTATLSNNEVLLNKEVSTMESLPF